MTEFACKNRGNGCCLQPPFNQPARVLEVTPPFSRNLLQLLEEKTVDRNLVLLADEKTSWRSSCSSVRVGCVYLGRYFGRKICLSLREITEYRAPNLELPTPRARARPRARASSFPPPYPTCPLSTLATSSIVINLG